LRSCAIRAIGRPFMAIKFVCSCGKRLRARDEMAARRSRCPRCGAPVGIPSLQPTLRGATLGPMSPAERQWTRTVARPSGLSSPDAAPAEVIASPSPKDGTVPHSSKGQSPFFDTTPVTVSSRDSSRHPSTEVVGKAESRWWHPSGVEKHWYQCLLYPLRAWPLVLGLALVLTAFCGGAALALPALLGEFRADGSWLLWGWLPCLSIPFLILGYAFGFLNCALSSAMAGEVRHVRWPGRDVGLALKSGASWLICFLAGPVVPAAASVLAWIHGGDLALLDWIILAQASILAISCWLLLILAVNQNDRLRDLSPVCLLGLMHRLGHRLVGWAVFSSILGLAHGCLASVALEKVHDDVALGWLLLFLCCTSGMFFATFLFRWVGVWFYWDRIRGKTAPKP
jgi:hypothetical protein